MTFGAVSAQEVIPDFYSEPGIHPNRALINGGSAEAIDPFTGSLQWHFTDLHLPGNGGFDLKVIRSYNGSSVNISNLFGNVPVAGLGWSIHFGRVMKARENTICNNKDAQTVADNPVLELPDGSRQLLAFTGVQSPLMLTAQRWRGDCILTGSSGLSVMSPDGLRYDMTQLVNVGSGVNPMFAWYATRITDRNGNFAVINYAAAASPEVTSVTTSDGRSISFSYADPGTAARRVTTITASGGQTYSYSYQPVAGTMGLYHLTGVRRPDGSSWTFSYNGNWGTSPGSYLLSRVTYTPTSKVATRGALSEVTHYDGLGRRTGHTIGGVARTFVWDAAGRQTFASHPGSSAGVTYGYDALDRIVSERNADGTVKTHSYGPGSISTTDERGKVTTRVFRAYGDPQQTELMRINAPEPTASVVLERNSKGMVTAITQAGLTRTYGYNPQYQLIRVTHPETGVTTYGRDAAGNMTSRVVGASGVTAYTYDGQNRLQTVTYPGSTAPVTKTYSRTHKLKSVVNAGHQRTYQYDANDNLVSESLVVDGLNFTVGYGHIDLQRCRQSGVAIVRRAAHAVRP